MKYLNAFFLLAIVNIGVTGYAREEIIHSDYNRKVAYLYNFLYFVDWPEKQFESATSSYRICVIGDHSFANALGALEAKKIKERSIKITSVLQDREFQYCHLLFIADSESTRLNKLLTIIGNKPVLLVSDMNKFSLRGGMIGLVYDKRRLTMDINVTTANNSSLKISAKLLEVAHVIE